MLALTGLLALGAPVAADAAERSVGADARTAVTVTIYNRDLGLVSERRRVALAEGENRLALKDVSAALRPETVLLRGPGFHLIEQSFVFDLLTPQRLLEDSVGKDVRVVRTHPQTGEETLVDAELLSIAQGPVLRIGDRIETTVPGRIVFDRLPEGLRQRPTLLARLESASGGETELEFSYLTGGLSWAADYLAELNAAEDALDLTGLITVTNRTGIGFADAAVRLVAGEVSQAYDVRPLSGAQVMAEAAAAPAAPAPQALGDRYLYDLGRRVNLAPRETKQVTLLRAENVRVRKDYRFETLVNANPRAEEIGPLNAAITLEVENEAQGGLGQPLPAGIVRIYQVAGGDGGKVFAGADRIRHVPEGERFELSLGTAFDVTGRARRTAFERLSNRSYETAQEITVKNAKAKAVAVRLVGHMPPGWRMLSETAPHERKTANKIVWTLDVPGKGEAKLGYRVRVSR
ncbi:MAG: DUF4139 domain-containing protein [Kiloniellaceae bacterium]